MPDQPQPPDISDAAKIALALQMLAIADRIINAAADAPETMDPGDFADSLSDPNGAAIDEALSNLYEGTHVTNIASIETAKLRAQLADPKFRKANPYVMIVVTNPNARVGHAVMDGFVMSSEEAQFSPFLPPFGFGCDCQVIPLTVAQSQAAGLVGANPVGTLEEFLTGQGVTASGRGGGFTTPQGQPITPGPAPGFSPAFDGTDMAAQLEALRAKAEQIRAEDPQAWAELNAWLLFLFGYDILRQDPPQDQAA